MKRRTFIWSTPGSILALGLALSGSARRASSLEVSSKKSLRGAVYFPGAMLTSAVQTTETEGMQAPIIDDELWTLIKPLLPKPKRRNNERRGRPRVSDRAALNGVLFVLRTGIRWNHLPTALGFGSSATCWRRLDAWQKAGVWNRLHALLLDKLRESGQLDLSYAAVDSSSVRAVGAGEKPGQTRRIVRDQVRSTTFS